VCLRDALWIANTDRGSLVRIAIGRGGELAVRYDGPELVGPADLVHVAGTSAPAQLLVVSSSFAAAFAPPEAGRNAPARPGPDRRPMTITVRALNEND
jgi:hypothetical protein